MPRNSYSLPVFTKIRSHEPLTSIRSRTRFGLAKPANTETAGITTLPLAPKALTSCVTSAKTGVSRLDESIVKINAHGMRVARGRYSVGSGTGLGATTERDEV